MADKKKEPVKLEIKFQVDISKPTLGTYDPKQEPKGKEQ